MPRPTRTRRLLPVAAALVIAGVLVAPIVLTQPGGSTTASRCTTSLLYRHHLYERRPATGISPTQGIATGVGVLHGCGQPPTNANVRSLTGIHPSRAVAIEGDPDIYIRAGLCSARAAAQLAHCLRAATQ